MKITRIKPQRSDSRRLSVFLDGRYSFSLDQKTIIELGLEPGAELSAEEVERISFEEQLRRAKEYATLLLSYRARTVKELRDRLVQRKFGPEVIEAALARFQDLKLLDDGRFARDYAEDRVKLGHRGKFVVSAELRKLGLERRDVDAALAQAPDELGPAKELVEKYLARYARLEPDVRRRRLYALLARRGFSPDTIRAALELPDSDS